MDVLLDNQTQQTNTFAELTVNTRQAVGWIKGYKAAMEHERDMQTSHTTVRNIIQTVAVESSHCGHNAVTPDTAQVRNGNTAAGLQHTHSAGTVPAYRSCSPHLSPLHRPGASTEQSVDQTSMRQEQRIPLMSYQNNSGLGRVTSIPNPRMPLNSRPQRPPFGYRPHTRPQQTLDYRPHTRPPQFGLRSPARPHYSSLVTSQLIDRPHIEQQPRDAVAHLGSTTISQSDDDDDTTGIGANQSTDQTDAYGYNQLEQQRISEGRLNDSPSMSAMSSMMSSMLSGLSDVQAKLEQTILIASQNQSSQTALTSQQTRQDSFAEQVATLENKVDAIRADQGQIKESVQTIMNAPHSIIINGLGMVQAKLDQNVQQIAMQKQCSQTALTSQQTRQDSLAKQVTTLENKVDTIRVNQAQMKESVQKITTLENEVDTIRADLAQMKEYVQTITTLEHKVDKLLCKNDTLSDEYEQINSKLHTIIQAQGRIVDAGSNVERTAAASALNASHEDLTGIWMPCDGSFIFKEADPRPLVPEPVMSERQQNASKTEIDITTQDSHDAFDGVLEPRLSSELPPADADRSDVACDTDSSALINLDDNIAVFREQKANVVTPKQNSKFPIPKPEQIQTESQSGIKEHQNASPLSIPVTTSEIPPTELAPNLDNCERPKLATTGQSVSCPDITKTTHSRRPFRFRKKKQQKEKLDDSQSVASEESILTPTHGQSKAKGKVLARIFTRVKRVITIPKKKMHKHVSAPDLNRDVRVEQSVPERQRTNVLPSPTRGPPPIVQIPTMSQQHTFAQSVDDTELKIPKVQREQRENNSTQKESYDSVEKNCDVQAQPVYRIHKKYENQTQTRETVPNHRRNRSDEKMSLVKDDQPKHQLRVAGDDRGSGAEPGSNETRLPTETIPNKPSEYKPKMTAATTHTTHEVGSGTPGYPHTDEISADTINDRTLCNKPAPLIDRMEDKMERERETSSTERMTDNMKSASQPFSRTDCMADKVERTSQPMITEMSQRNVLQTSTHCRVSGNHQQQTKASNTAEGTAGRHEKAEGAGGRHGTAEGASVRQEAVEDAGGRQEAVEEAGDRQEAAGGAGGRQETAEGETARQEAVEGTGGRQETAEGVGGRQDTAGGAGGRQEVVDGASGRQETAEGVGGRQETAGGAGGRQETADDAANRQEAAGGAGDRQETVEDAGGRQETAGGAGDRKETAEGVGGRQETAGSVGGRQETAEGAGGRQETVDDGGGRQKTAGGAGGQQETAEGVGGRQETAESVGGRQETAGGASGRQETVDSAGDRQEAAGGAGDRQGTIEDAGGRQETAGGAGGQQETAEGGRRETAEGASVRQNAVEDADGRHGTAEGASGRQKAVEGAGGRKQAAGGTCGRQETAEGADGRQDSVQCADGRQEAIEGADDRQETADCAGGRQEAAEGAGARQEAVECAVGRQQAAEGADGQKEAFMGAGARQEAVQCADGQQVPVESADGRQDAVENADGRQETTKCAGGRQEAVEGADGRHETTEGARGRQEAAGGAGGRGEAIEGAVGQQEAVEGADGRQKAVEVAGGGEEAVEGARGRQEALESAGGRKDTAEVQAAAECAGGRKETVKGADGRQETCESAGGRQEAVEGAGGQKETVKSAGCRQETVEGADGQQQAVEGASGQQETAEGAGGRQEAVEVAGVQEGTDQGASVKEGTDQGTGVEEGTDQGAGVQEGTDQGAGVKKGTGQGAGVKEGTGQGVSKDQSGTTSKAEGGTYNATPKHDSNILEASNSKKKKSEKTIPRKRKGHNKRKRKIDWWQ